MKISIVVGKIFAREKSSFCRANLLPKLFPRRTLQAPERERKPPPPVVDDRGEEHPL
jgi:hypothetical protein